MSVPGERTLPPRTSSQPVLPRRLCRPTKQLVRQVSLNSPLSPECVPDHVTIETRDAGGETVTWKVYVTEVNGTRTLDLYCGWTPGTPRNKPPLKHLPVEVCDLLHLERLCVSHNVLTSLPHTFPHLTHLRELLLHQNKFIEFPSVICRLPSLELLWLGTNKIPRIPDSISTLSLLRCLHLDHNQLTELPESLCQLKQLQVLFLNHNSIWKLSENIGQLISLRHLLLHHNHIGELPLSICQLAAIERLDLRHNQLKHLPAGFRLFQTEKNGDGRSRVLTSNNPFDNTLKRMTSSEQGSPNPRPRTLSFPLSAHGRRRSDTLHSRSPSPVVISPRPVFTHSHSEDRP